MNDTTVVIAPNLKRRLSGVTATIARLVPLQARYIGIKATGYGLPGETPHLGLAEVVMLSRKKRRVWHARRNTEMLLGLALKYGLRKNLKLLFTSASQRTHSAYTKWLIERMDHVVATSAKGKFYLNVPADVIHHGIDANRFTPEEDKQKIRNKLGLPSGLLVGCFGRIRHQKGTDLFVETMMALAAQHPDLKGIILGRATEKHIGFERELKDKIAKAGLADRILFCGEVPVDVIPHWYSALDLFIAPQRWEGFGLTPLEAMACGVPVIATDVGAFSELIVDGETGTIIARDDLEAMITATKSVLDNPQLSKEWSDNARKHVVENFTLQDEADALIDIYRSLLEQ